MKSQTWDEVLGKRIRHIRVPTAERARSNPVRNAVRAQVGR